jgi:hypothetical protein
MHCVDDVIANGAMLCCSAHALRYQPMYDIRIFERPAALHSHGTTHSVETTDSSPAAFWGPVNLPGHACGTVKHRDKGNRPHAMLCAGSQRIADSIWMMYAPPDISAWLIACLDHQSLLYFTSLFLYNNGLTHAL